MADLPEKVTWFRLPEYVQQLMDSGSGSGSTPNVKSFFFDLSTNNYAGTVKVYQDGELVSTVSSHGEILELDMSKSIAIVGSSQGTSVSIYLENGDDIDAALIPPMSSDDWFNSLQNVATNGYAVVELYAVS